MELPQESSQDKPKTFAEHLEWASSIVNAWPAWKRQILGTPPDNTVTITDRGPIYFDWTPEKYQVRQALLKFNEDSDTNQ